MIISLYAHIYLYDEYDEEPFNTYRVYIMVIENMFKWLLFTLKLYYNFFKPPIFLLFIPI